MKKRKIRLLTLMLAMVLACTNMVYADEQVVSEAATQEADVLETPEETSEEKEILEEVPEGAPEVVDAAVIEEPEAAAESAAEPATGTVEPAVEQTEEQPVTEAKDEVEEPGVEVQEEETVTQNEGPGEIKAMDQATISFNDVKDGGNISINGIPEKVTYSRKEISFNNIKVISLNAAGGEEKELKEGTDYTVKYEDNVEIGIGFVYFTGSGNYAPNTITRSFEIIDNNPVTAVQVTYTASYNRVTVSCSNPGNVCVALISGNMSDYKDTWLEGTLIEAGTTRTIYNYLDYKGVRHALNADTAYTMIISKDYYFQYGEEKNVIINIRTTKGSGESAYKDGYSQTKLIAKLQKNKTVKLTWKQPDKRAKKYTLYKLSNDEKTWEKLADTKKRTYTVAAFSTPKPDTPMVYRLDALDASGSILGQYITPTAPLLLYMENADNDNALELCFSQMRESQDLSHKLMIAKNKAMKSEKYTNGFNDEWSKLYQSSDLYPIEGYQVSKKVSLNAVRATYDLSEPDITTGNTYYACVQNVYYYEGDAYTSAPSNVLSRKSGPGKSYILDIVGLKYDKADAKNGNLKNIARANRYLTLYNIGEENITVSADDFIHHDNDGTCAKNGTIFFIGASGNNISGYQLLRCDTRYGKYKVIKKYSLTKDKKNIWKCEVSANNILSGTDVYCLHYTSFPPEKTYYYAVRAVSGKTTGGFGDGTENTTKIDKTAGTEAIGTGATQILITWEHDDCAKQYWIYRSTTSSNDLKDYQKIGTAKASSTIKVTGDDGSVQLYNKYTDKKVPKADTMFYYKVKPVYDTKKAKTDATYNAALTNGPVGAMASAAYENVKNFTAKPYSTGRNILSWKQIKNITGYDIERSTSKTSTNWDKVAKVESTGNSTGTKTYYDTKVEVGVGYYYRIRPTTEKSEGLTWAMSAKVTNKPLMPKEVKASLKNASEGANLTWKRDSKESPSYFATSQFWYEIKYSDDGGSWKELASEDYSTTSYRDTKKLKRGVLRKYKITPVYNGVAGVPAEVSYSKPTEIAVCNKDDKEISSITITGTGETANLKVYSYVNSSQKSSTLKTINFSNDNGKVVDVRTNVDSDCCNVTIKSVGKGTAYVTFSTPGYNTYTDGRTGNLYKTIKITVK